MTADNRPKQTNTTGENLHKVRLWHIWNGMHQRCYNPNVKEYQYYGAKGVHVCDEWNRDNINGYMNFREWSLQNGYEEDLSIDRIDTNEDYTPMNCRWISQKEQLRNRTNNVPVTVNGITYKTLSEAVEALNRTEDGWTIRTRIKHGMTPQEAFNTPIEERGHSRDEPIAYDGQTHRSIRECCRSLNINYNRVQSYKRYHHTTWTEAITHYLP